MKCNESELGGDSKRLLILPILHFHVKAFIDLLQSLEDSKSKTYPIMITGDPGVGKSLFVHIYRKLFEDKHPDKKIVRINAAAIPENLLESTLFGHEKGAFTGAISKNKGLVEGADLLILEEIGDISRSVQAKLLTFIEDGYYYSVGSAVEKRAKDIKIISTTNKKAPDFRQDFFDRFFKVVVPPLHERRVDVLYYIEEKLPGFISRCKPFVILGLLAHNWPGNMREVDLIIQENMFQEILFSHASEDSSVQMALEYVHFLHSSVDLSKANRLYKLLEGANIDVKLLEKELNKFGLGLNSDNKKMLKGSDISPKDLSDEEKDFDRKYGTKSVLFDMQRCPSPFLAGWLRYCQLINEDPHANRNLLDVDVPVANVSKVVNRMTSAKDQPWFDLVYNVNSYLNSQKVKDNEIDIFDMKEKELIDVYRQGLLKRCDRKVAEVHRRSGVAYSTLGSYYKKYNEIH